MKKTVSFDFAAKYAKHCRKFINEQQCVMDALESKCPGNIALPPPEIEDIVDGCDEGIRQGIVYLPAENWTLDTYGHKMVEPFMFSYHREGNCVIFDK